MRQLLSLLLLVAPSLAHAQAFRIGQGAQMTCQPSAPVAAASRGILWCKSTDSDLLYYTTPSGSSAAVSSGGGASVGNYTFSGNAVDLIGAATMSIAPTTATAITLGQNTTISGSKTFTTGTGAVTLGGNTTISGTRTFTTGTGAVTVNGATSIASGVDIAAAGGASDIDYSLSSGIITAPTGGVRGAALTVNASSGDATLSSTSGLVKLDAASAVQCLDPLYTYVSGIATTRTLGIQAENSTDATGGAQVQYGPVIMSEGSAWDGSAAKDVAVGFMSRPVANATTDAIMDVVFAKDSTTPQVMASFVQAGSGTTASLQIPYLGNNAGGNLMAIPAGSSTDTLCAIAATQTLSNKSISGSANTLTNIGVSSMSATGTPSSSTYLRGDNSWASISASWPLQNGSSTNTYTYGGATGATAHQFATTNAATAGDRLLRLDSVSSEKYAIKMAADGVKINADASANVFQELRASDTRSCTNAGATCVALNYNFSGVEIDISSSPMFEFSSAYAGPRSDLAVDGGTTSKRYRIVAARHYVTGQASSATCVAGTGAGTSGSPTCTAVNDAAGLLSVTTATTPAGSGATVATVTFNTAYATNPYCVISPADADAAGFTNPAAVYIDRTSGSTTTMVVKNASATGLTGSTTYEWAYHCFQ